jgi:hypothetical protein
MPMAAMRAPECAPQTLPDPLLVAIGPLPLLPLVGCDLLPLAFLATAHVMFLAGP